MIDPLTEELGTLAFYSDAPQAAADERSSRGVPVKPVTRVVFTPTDLRARAYVKKLCLAAGLLIREDAVGNTFARWTGDDPALPAVATGSHIDAIPNAGMYDGTVGVLGGLEAIRILQRAGVRPKRSIELILFTSEEPTRFGIGCLGSRLMSGSRDASAGDALRDKQDRTLNEIRKEAGFAGDLSSVRMAEGHYSAFVELHIEQGPLLERAGIPIGIVTAIAAPAALRIFIEGEGGHAGAVLMPDRKDAFAAAAEIAVAVESAALSTGSIDTVATCGVCDVFPGAINSIPSRVRLDLDVRDTSEVRRATVLDKISEACNEVGARRGVSVRQELINADPPAICDPVVIEALRDAAKKCGVEYQEMVSRAYHDSTFMSRIAPTSMLFIPCADGVSHRPDEYASPEAISTGVKVLAEALGHLATV